MTALGVTKHTNLNKIIHNNTQHCSVISCLINEGSGILMRLHVYLDVDMYLFQTTRQYTHN